MICKKRNDIHHKRWNLAGIMIMIFWTMFPKTVSGSIISTERMVVRVAKPTHTVDPWWFIDPNNPQSVDGVLPALYQELQNFENVTIEYVSVGDQYVTNTSSYIRHLLDDDVIDMALDVTFPFVEGYSYTTPFLLLNFRALIIQKLEEPSPLQLFAPFELSLWLVLAGALLFGASCKCLIKIVAEGKFQKFSSLRKAGKHVAIDTFSTLLTSPEEGAADAEKFPILKLYQAGLFFLVLIVSSTYTANLAAILTKKSKVLVGPTTMEELKDATVCTVWANKQQLEIIRRFTKDVVEPPAFPTLVEGRNWALDQLLNKGNCTAIVSSQINLNRLLEEDCDTLYEPHQISLARIPYYHTMLANTPKQKETFHRMNNAFGRLLSDPKLVSIEKKLSYLDNSCDSDSDDEKNSESTLKIGIAELSIPIVCHFLASVVSLLLTIIYWYIYGASNVNKDGNKDKVISTSIVDNTVFSPAK